MVSCAQELRQEKAQFDRELAQLKAQLDFKDKAIADLSSFGGAPSDSTALGTSVSPTGEAMKSMSKLRTENEELALKVCGFPVGVRVRVCLCVCLAVSRMIAIV